MLLTSPATILATYIIEQALMSNPVEEADWPLYISYMPDSSDVKTNCGAIYDVPGLKNGRLMSGTVIQHYGVQLKLRSDDYITGWAKMESIVTNLDTIHNVEVEITSGENYQISNVTRVEPIAPLGIEKGTKGRRLFVNDFLVTVKEI